MQNINSILLTSILDNNYDKVVSLIKTDNENIDINYKNHQGYSYLFYALNNTNEKNFKTKLKIADLLIDYNIDIESTNQLGETIIYRSIIFNIKPLFDYILSKNININHQDLYGFTPLMIAINSERAEMINDILLKNPDLSILNNNMDSVFNLVFINKKSVIDKIFSNYKQFQETFRIVNNNGYNTLSFAVKYKNLNITKKLLDLNLDISQNNQDLFKIASDVNFSDALSKLISTRDKKILSNKIKLTNNLNSKKIVHKNSLNFIKNYI